MEDASGSPTAPVAPVSVEEFRDKLAAVALDLPHVQIFSQPRAWRAGPVGQLHQVAVGGDAPPSVDTVWQAWRDVVAAKLKITA